MFKTSFFFLTLLICFPLAAWKPSEIRDYRLLCKKASERSRSYDRLRRSSLHRKMIEPFSSTDSASYRLQVDRENVNPELDTLLSQLDSKIKEGRKRKRRRSSKRQPFSTLLLRHAQIGVELEREFGDLSHLRILQIGSGFGALPAYLAKSSHCLSYTLLDYPECIALQKKFLSSCDLHHIHYLTTQELHALGEYDLVICVFPFTQWADTSLRSELLQKIAKIQKGYITCHQPWHPSLSSNQLEDQLLLQLARQGHRVHCAPERGNPSLRHSVIRWGTAATAPAELPLLLPSTEYQTQSAVAMGEWGARLGDQLLVYAHAKWVAHMYGLPILPRRFPYAEGFAFSTLYPEPGPGFLFKNAAHPRNRREMDKAVATPSTYFEIDYFAESDFEAHYYPSTGTFFYTCWRDPGFLEALRKDFQPHPSITDQLEKPLLDDSDIHLAVHVRLGGGFDNKDFLQTSPNLTLKAPQHIFYLQQIERVVNLFPNKSFQVHLFTDDPDPKHLAEMYMGILKNPRLHFTYRRSENRHDAHVLDDFFAMRSFDCLIHPQSNFSTMASILGDFAIRITPVHAVKKSGGWVADTVECTLNGNHPLFH